MVADSKQPPLSFFILSLVLLTTHFNDYKNEGFKDRQTGFSILVGNIFIIDANFSTER